MPGDTKYTAQLPELTWFNPSVIRADDLQFICAPRRAGKSSLLYHWTLFFARSVVNPVAVSHTDEMNGFFEKKLRIPPEFIHSEVSDRLIKNIFQRQQIMMHSPPPGFTFQSHGSTHVFFDDVADDAKALNSPAMKTFAYNGRQYDCGGTIISQSYSSVLRHNRSQFDRIAILHDTNLSNRQFVWNQIFGDLTWEQFNYYYNQYIPNHGCLVYSKPKDDITPVYTRFRVRTQPSCRTRNSSRSSGIKTPPSKPSRITTRFDQQHTRVKVDWEKAQYGLSCALPGDSGGTRVQQKTGALGGQGKDIGFTGGGGGLRQTLDSPSPFLRPA